MRSLALRIVQIGAMVAVLIVLPSRAYDLDRFLAPKEVVLHVTAWSAAACCGLWSIKRRQAAALQVFLLLSGASAFFATDHWLAIRAVAISVSGVLLYWSAQAINDRRTLNAVGFATVVAAITSLMQAYGIRLEIFAVNRSPGGTLGNRNFVAHIAAIGLPVLFAMSYRFALPGVALVSAALVLTRSRAGWLATAVMLVAYIGAILFTRSWPLLKRLPLMLAASAVGIAAALILPNSLRWNSDNPYLESVQDVANYQQGSGHGRLVQYQRSLAIAARHPLLGIGPGNWPVVYPKNVPRNDPSLDPNRRGRTYNPWPSSDWVAFVTERGFAAAVVLFIAFLAIARRADPVGLGVLAATLVAGMFDAVLLLALPTLLVWVALGSMRDRADPPLEPVTLDA